MRDNPYAQDAALLRERMTELGLRDPIVRQAVMDETLYRVKLYAESGLTCRDGWQYIDTAQTEIERTDDGAWRVILFGRRWTDRPVERLGEVLVNPYAC